MKPPSFRVERPEIVKSVEAVGAQRGSPYPSPAYGPVAVYASVQAMREESVLQGRGVDLFV